MAQYLVSVCVSVSNHADVYVREWLFPASGIGTEEVDRDHISILLERFDYFIDPFYVFRMLRILWQCYRLSAFGNTIWVLMEKVSLCATLIEFHLFSPHNDIA